MAELKKLPIEIESFEKMRREDFYYVDKTRLIEQLLSQWGEVNLFTRPRRFGKTLNMSMFQNFFEIGRDATMFDGLDISKNIQLCEKYQGKFPVVFISLKGVNGNTYEEAFGHLIKIINREARRLQLLLESSKLTQYDKKLFEQLLDRKMDEETLASSIQELTELLEKHYGRQVIVLIDEYDVPLSKANENGYYDEMVLLLRNFLGNVLKTNDSLKFAILTGCLRIAKESIFTGLNNFKVYSITDVRFDETFGFTDMEVKKMLEYYGLDKYSDTVKEWYDGYRFGNTDVYCPWDVINFCSDHLENQKLEPKNYWANTSGNNVINHFIESVNEPQKVTKIELEQLVNGGMVQKEINTELTYKDLYSSIDNLWSTLFMTGYLTWRGEADGKMVGEFCDALLKGRTDEVEKIFTDYMRKTISVRDMAVQKTMKENFYHGMVLGILSFKEDWSVMSNRESGDGFSDILIRSEDADAGIVIEIKYAENGKLEEECEKALKQIVDKRYTEELKQDGIHKILKYGIACYKKTCKVILKIEE